MQGAAKAAAGNGDDSEDEDLLAAPSQQDLKDFSEKMKVSF